MVLTFTIESRLSILSQKEASMISLVGISHK